VNHSRFSVFPPTSFDEAPGSKKIHIPVAILGIIGYGLIMVFALFNKVWITLQLTEIGFAFAAFLTYLEAYVMEKWCIYCIYSMGIITVILLLSILAVVFKRTERTTPFLA
jgi:vitamin-K-epoxide reductase (warfarin-sensitive)